MPECKYCFQEIEFLKVKGGKWVPLGIDGTDHRKVCTRNEKVVNGAMSIKCSHGRNRKWCTDCRYGSNR